MPELPEVEVVRRGLEPAVTGARVTSVEVFDERSLRRHLGGASDFAARMTGAVLDAPRRRGKFLWIPTGAEALMVHLGMSGQVLLREPEAPLDRFTRVRWLVEHPDHGELAINFADQRIFGELALRPVDERGVPDLAAHIALDPLESDFDPVSVSRRLRTRTQGVKAALLDQQLISGVGNIYADEALWRARLHYLIPGQRLTHGRALELIDHVREVMLEALDEGGTSFDAQYVNVNGRSGSAQIFLRVYGRDGQPCKRCGTPIKREKFMNRSSHFCPVCQRKR